MWEKFGGFVLQFVVVGIIIVVILDEDKKIDGRENSTKFLLFMTHISASNALVILLHPPNALPISHLFPFLPLFHSQFITFFFFSFFNFK